MASQEDIQFGKHAVVLGFIQPNELANCLVLQEKKRCEGEDTPLHQILQDEGYIDVQQLEEIQKRTTIALNPTERRLNPEIDLQKQYLSTTNRIKMKFFGRYEILEEVARGGMGRVYKAHDPQLNRTIALKVLLSRESETDVQRFFREAQSTARLSHPYIIHVHDIGLEGEQPFFTMDFVQGENLGKMIKQQPFSIDDTLDIMSQIGEAVHYAHGQGIIHRDLKPSNVMIDSEGYPKVMDFGLAKVKGASKLSESGIMMGTLHYMPPEQADGRLKEIDARSDVYSLGVMLYELLTNTLPFEGDTFSQMLQQILYQSPQKPSDVNQDIPYELDCICLKAMSKIRESRYQTAIEFVEDLLRFSSGEPVLACQQDITQILTKPSPKVKKWFVALIAAFFLGCSALAVVIWQSLQNAQTAPIITEKIEKNSPEISSNNGDQPLKTPDTQINNSDPTFDKLSINNPENNSENNPESNPHEHSPINPDGQIKIQTDGRVNTLIENPPILNPNSDSSLLEPKEEPKKPLKVVWKDAESMWEQDYIKRLQTWGRCSGRANWAPSEDQGGIFGVGSGKITTAISEEAWRITGSLKSISKKTYEYGVLCEVGDKVFLALSFQALSAKSLLITAVEKTEKQGKIVRSPFYSKVYPTKSYMEFSLQYSSEELLFFLNGEQIAVRPQKQSPKAFSLYVDKAKVHFKDLEKQVGVIE